MTTKYIFDFQSTGSVGPDILGGKGFGLSKMTQIGIPVPPGFVVSTDACKVFYDHGNTLTDEFWQDFDTQLTVVERQTGKKFGGSVNPLLLSVRSGAPISMPGMMDTILNIGLNDESVLALAKSSGNRHFAFDSYRRLVQMYGEVVEGIDKRVFEGVMTLVLDKELAGSPIELSEHGLVELVGNFKTAFEKYVGKPFPQDPHEQLHRCVMAVFESWHGKRAQTYREMQGIPNTLGTAVNVQTMVFGNLGEDSGTGVCFTRNPSTGESKLYGEFLQSAQGEDVVSGIRTPEPVAEMEKIFPDAYKDLLKHTSKLEMYNRDMQDIEFTVQQGELFILQTRNGKRTAHAGVKIAVDMTNEGLISEDEAIMRIDPSDLTQLLLPQLPADHGMDVVATGLSASPGAAVGFITLDADIAEQRAQKGEHVILVRPETSPDDIHGFIAAQGILTAKGGLTSHAAVVARGMGKPCITGCAGLDVDLEARHISIFGVIYDEGTLITIDGTTGSVIIGEPELVEASNDGELEILLGWADSKRRLKVMANADTPADARNAKKFGAEGIGLCRTEHMFFGEERLPKMQAMILANNVETRAEALEELLPIQTEDFYGIFRELGDNPVIIRLLDPPLHEFLPEKSEATSSEIARRIDELSETNPMLGMRGCRLGLVYPEIYEMQVRAIADASVKIHEESGIWPRVQIMMPMVGFISEMVQLRKNVQTILDERTVKDVPIGMMIELPRTCVVAEEMTQAADFFSFGTNDLTQTTLGFSRDDAENAFMGKYTEDGILVSNPFETLDVSGVGKLINMAVDSVESSGHHMSFGACGEHGGDPASIEFFHAAGLDYVSCSPFRIPIARLAAAQAALSV
ncbi:MAG: pyruvate, phosphate dikinase [Chloroflexi bacterium]|jgi:pyruvate, orthophosphate dikinase|nr:pyruvate, phosphate dikinase [Chloroflexota bacterium]MBT5253396.1 pyruvate, phosphate dikinase [Chloroflexota bacterium]